MCTAASLSRFSMDHARMVSDECPSDQARTADELTHEAVFENHFFFCWVRGYLFSKRHLMLEGIPGVSL